MNELQPYFNELHARLYNNRSDEIKRDLFDLIVAYNKCCKKLGLDIAHNIHDTEFFQENLLRPSSNILDIPDVSTVMASAKIYEKISNQL